MAQNLAKPGGSKLWHANQRLDTDDLNDIGTLVEQSLWDGFVARVFEGTDGFFGDDCMPSKDVGDLDYLVEAGMGLISLSGGEFEPDYTPIFVATQQSGSCDAHDAANPRIDILSLAPDDIDDQPSAEKILAGGVLVPQVKNTRRRRTFSLVYTAGVAAPAPAQPATPAGHLLVAHIDVPAAAGAITVTDERTRLVISTGILRRRVRAGSITIGAEAGNTITVGWNVVDVEDDTELAVEQHFLVRIYDLNPSLLNAGATILNGLGYQISANGGHSLLLKSDAGGVCGVRVDDTAPGYAGDIWVEITPVSYHNGAVLAECLGFPVVVKITFV